MNQEKILSLNSIAAQHRKNGLRHGQSLMNALWEVSPELYAVVKNSPADCFYQDEKIDAFWKLISEVWS